MKKLIALFLSAAMVLSFSFVVMAEDGTETNGEQTITTTFDGDNDDVFVTTITNVPETDQITLLAYKDNDGEGLSASGSNIEYIDQITAGTERKFTYRMKSEVEAGDKFVVKVGGSSLDAALAQTIIPVAGGEDTGFDIYGTIGNAAEAWEMEDYDPFFATKVSLKSAYGEDAIEVQEIFSGDTEWRFTELEAGSYFIQIERLGYLTRYIKVAVTESSVNVDDLVGVTNLYGGDFIVDGDEEGSWGIDYDDFLMFSSGYNKGEEDVGYQQQFDLEVSLGIDYDDFLIFSSAYNKDWTIYTGAETALD